MITVKWCNICNEREANGILEVLDEENDITIELDACEECVSDPKKVEFIK